MSPTVISFIYLKSIQIRHFLFPVASNIFGTTSNGKFWPLLLGDIIPSSSIWATCLFTPSCASGSVYFFKVTVLPFGMEGVWIVCSYAVAEVKDSPGSLNPSTYSYIFLISFAPSAMWCNVKFSFSFCILFTTFICAFFFCPSFLAVMQIGLSGWLLSMAIQIFHN